MSGSRIALPTQIMFMALVHAWAEAENAYNYNSDRHTTDVWLRLTAQSNSKEVKGLLNPEQLACAGDVAILGIEKTAHLSPRIAVNKDSSKRVGFVVMPSS